MSRSSITGIARRGIHGVGKIDLKLPEPRGKLVRDGSKVLRDNLDWQALPEPKPKYQAGPSMIGVGLLSMEEYSFSVSESIARGELRPLRKPLSTFTVPLSLNLQLSKRNLILGSYIITALEKICSKKSLPYLEEYQTFLSEQIANIPGAEEIGEYRFVWKQADKQVKEAINKIKEEV